MAPALRMIVRNMERRPLRTALGIGGIADLALIDLHAPETIKREA